MQPSATLLNKVRQTFCPDEVQRVIDALGRLNLDLPAAAADRIGMAVVKLCQEDGRERFAHYCDAARKDYRDVLLWAEHPNESRLSPRQRQLPELLKAARRDDRLQLKTWLER